VFRVQIGAPRGNDTKLYPGVREPGVVFRCPIAKPCNAVKFDTAGKLATELIILVAYLNMEHIVAGNTSVYVREAFIFIYLCRVFHDLIL